MDSRTVRERFLAFFAERAHERVPSSSLVPNDPTLMLTNAGMNQFKPYFLGEQTAPYDRAVSCQRCMRAGGKHNDIDSVGRTARHLTFFEMLGNFSFGDYYKSEACRWAWELVTEGYGLDGDRIWPTVFETDDEAFEIWRDEVGVPAARIIRMGKKDNFWSMGVAGPCGPCSELSYDLGDAYGPPSEQGPAGNEERYVEIWNLVFMQNDCNAQIEPVAELPKKNIDTGMGLERVAMVLQEVPTVFETDILRGLIATAEQLTGTTYGKDQRSDVSLRIIADHARSVSFMLADGVLPSNEERGYVLRLIMRRAIRQARLLGHEGPVLGGLIHATDTLMGEAYPELGPAMDLALDVAAREEERFDATLKQGSSLLDSEIERLKAEGSKELTGNIAFRLHDTWGFPIDITTEIASEAGLSVDRSTFDRLMSEQRERARSARKGDEPGKALDASLAALDSAATEFIGYEHLEESATVIALVARGQERPTASAGEEIDVVLDRTVFYAEGGGQVGDRGRLAAEGGAADVLDTQRLVPGVTVHRVKVSDGVIAVGDEVSMTVDRKWRTGAERAHTATHVLHWILRDRLGEHAHQAGSLVEPGRLRFDFNHFEGLSADQISDISTELQERVLEDDEVRAYETSYDFAKSIGAMAFFGEKYGDFVRVVEVGDYSKELCGGTHVPHTARIGVVAVIGEGSVGANLRRVEALVGIEGLTYLKTKAAALDEVAGLLKTGPDEVTEKVQRLLGAQKEMEKALAKVQRASADNEAHLLAGTAADIGGGTRLVVARRQEDVDAMRALAQSLKGRLPSVVVVLGAAREGRANLVCAVSKDLVDKGISARDLLAPGAEMLGGGAGGKPDLAISGGAAGDRLDDALAAVESRARAALSP